MVEMSIGITIRGALVSDWTQVSCSLPPYLLQFNPHPFTWENPQQGEAGRRLHLAVIDYVPNEQMKCLITALWK